MFLTTLQTLPDYKCFNLCLPKSLLLIIIFSPLSNRLFNTLLFIPYFTIYYHYSSSMLFLRLFVFYTWFQSPSSPCFSPNHFYIYLCFLIFSVLSVFSFIFRILERMVSIQWTKVLVYYMRVLTR